MKPATRTRKVRRQSPDATRARARKIDTKAMATARAAAAERRRAEQDIQLSEYRAWLSVESGAYAALQWAREMYGPDAPEVNAAYENWRAAMSLAPQLPPDSAFQRERGELSA